MRKRRGRPLDGWLIVDKPSGIGSTDVVNRVRRAFDAQKAGHGGTLDPLATGLLPVAFGAATKTVPYVMDGTKLYRFTLRMGEARDTDDADGTVSATSGMSSATAMSIATTVAAMPTGLYTSVPLKRRSEVNPTMRDAGRATTTESTTRNSLTHQNSLRLARPVKVAYFLKKRPTA